MPNRRQGSFCAQRAGAASRKEISQEELAELAGLSRTYVSSVEREQRNISIDNIGKLAAALGTTPMALLDPDLASRLRGE
jgi:transcriptional regulator with XRE-family HTH domain